MVMAVPVVFADELRPSERPIVMVRARLPRAATGFLTFASIGALIRIVDIVRDRRHVARIRRTSAQVGFPLDRRMTILVSDERVLVWRARTGRGPQLLGHVDLSDVLSAHLPFVGGSPWRFVEIRRHNSIVRFQIEGRLAEQFVDTINARRTANE